MLVCHGRSVLRGSPHEDVEQVVGSSDASQDREREPRSLFARCGPQSRSSSIDSELGRRGIAKSVVKDERMAIIKSTSGQITHR